jgi:carbon monoxide dehydrogenase subunit G
MKLSFVLTKNADHVFEFLTEMQKFVSVHPVISKINATGNNSYLVYETLKFGPVPFSFSYPVTIESNPSEKKVVMRATVFRLTKIEMKFILKTENDLTVVEEEINFQSPLPLKSFMKVVFKKQHTQLFINIEQLRQH